MLLVELADLIGAIEGYCTKHNITLDDLITMKEATKRAFSDGTRGTRTNEKEHNMGMYWIIRYIQFKELKGRMMC